MQTAMKAETSSRTAQDEQMCTRADLLHAQASLDLVTRSPIPAIAR